MWIDCREAYLKQLRGKVAKNAGMLGKSKFARAVNASIGDALKQAACERMGTERMQSHTEYVVKDDTLSVIIKMGRKKPVEETYQYLTKEQLGEYLSGTEQTTALELASHDPHVYFLLRHHYGGDAEAVETGMREIGILQTKRRRRQ